MPRCVLADAERLYGAHGISFFTLSCAVVDGKKQMRPPPNWQMAPQNDLRFKGKNAVCIRTGYTEGAALPLVVMDADGDDAIAVVDSLLADTCAGLAVPQVQTQRGATGRHYYFRASVGAARCLKSGAKLVIRGVQTNVDIRAGSNGEGVGCILAPPTSVTGGGTYELLGNVGIHEAPEMPDALVSVLRGIPSGRAGPRPANELGAGAPSTSGHEALKQAALRDALARAGGASVGTNVGTNVGFPTRVFADSQSARVEFTHRGTRVCPVSRQEHKSNHFCVVLRAEERTGLPAFFVYCHSTKEGCKASGHTLLAFLDETEAAELCAEAGIDVAACLVQTTLGQAAVAIGKAQEALDRLMENPGGPWASLESVSVVACALCTAAGGHEVFRNAARLMLDGLLASTELTELERVLVTRAFQQANVPLDPLAILRGFAQGLNGKREQELMVIREAIVANTDSALEADVPKAAEALLLVLEYCERRDESTGRVEKLSNIADLGLFLYFVWRRIARYGFDRTQSSEAHQWTFYLFNGATYERGQLKQLSIRAEKHIRAIIKALSVSVPLHTRVMSLEVKCNTSDFISKALTKMQMSFMDVEQLQGCGLVSPNDFERELDMGNYIGFKNGVYDVYNDRFMPKGRVPLNVVVSMCTNYEYVPPDDTRCPEMREQIEEFYRKLHADNYEDANDERLAAMWLLSGSLLFRGNVCKKAYVFLGSEGDNGKSTFTELIQLTLGDYAVTGNRSSLSGTQEQMTLDPDLVANCKSLVCTFPEVQSVESGASAGFKFNCGKLKALTGQDEQSVRGLYRDKKGITIGFKPILHSNFMPQVDSDDSAARGRLWVARFGATFPAGLTEPDRARRRFPRIENLRGTMRDWAPFHFLLMLEALRDFRRRNCVLPPGAQQIEGSLMHQAIVAQTPEGKLRAWVEDNYSHVPLREKDSGTKLEAIYASYTTAEPPVHSRLLGKILFAKMLNVVYPNIGPHKNTNHTVTGMYLLR
jgi:hypothetical protein